MEISNFVQSALAGINLVGFDASLHGAIVPGDLISGLLASLPYSRWFTRNFRCFIFFNLLI